MERLSGADPHLPTAAHGIATEAEAELVTGTFNDTARTLPPTTLIGPIESRAARAPDATALVHGDTSLTYEELNTRANRLARHLRTLGARPGAVVAVSVPRSVELVVSLLAVLKAGAAYLPLDPDYPEQRLTYMLRDAAPVCAVTDRAGRLPEDTGTPLVVLDGLDVSEYLWVNPSRPLTPAHPAYVIYTSGSTGRPKGVVVSHGAIDNRLRWMQSAYGLTPDDRVLQKTPSSFDVSVWEFFWPLRQGAVLVVAEPGGHKDPGYLARLIREQAVTTCHFVPSMLQVFLTEAEAETCSSLRRVFCSGEALPRETADTFARGLPDVELHNLYGPTEAAVDVTFHACAADGTGPVPIGRPVWNTRLYVLDAALQPCPPGIAGELYLAGRQLADGYLNRPELTASRFVADPFGLPEERMYRTGDLAHWTGQGEVVYLGRTDDQVKLRGQRIELGEIEAAMAAGDGVDAACALVREDRPGEQRLVGYVTGAADPVAVRARLARELPEHMVPHGRGSPGRLPAEPQRQAGPARPARPGVHGRRGCAAALGRAGGSTDAAVRSGAGCRPGGSGRRLLRSGRDLAARRAARGARTGGVRHGAHHRLAVRVPDPGRARRPARLVGAGCPRTRWTSSCGCGAGRGGHRCSPSIRQAGSPGATPGCPPASARNSRCTASRPGAWWATRSCRAPCWRRRPTTSATSARSRSTAPTGCWAGPWAGCWRTPWPCCSRRPHEEVELLALLDSFPAEQWRERPTPEEGDALTAVLRMAGFERTDERDRADVLATLRRAGSPLAGLSARALSKIVDIVPNHARMMREHHHRSYEGDLLFFTAAAPARRTGSPARRGGPM